MMILFIAVCYLIKYFYGVNNVMWFGIICYLLANDSKSDNNNNVDC